MHTSILALALVLANVAEISTMSSLNHVQARRVLCEQSGYHELVTDFNGGDYSNNSALISNATYYLNAGQRWIDQRWSNQQVRKRFVTTIPTGAWSVSIPLLDYVERVDIWDGDDRYRLAQKTEAELRDMYSEDLFGNVTQARPKYYAEATHYEVELLQNPDFDSSPVIIDFPADGLAGLLTQIQQSPGAWIAMGGEQSGDGSAIPWSWANGELSVSNYGAGDSPVVAQYVGEVAAGDVTVTVELGGDGEGSVSIWIRSVDGTTSEFQTLSHVTTLTHTFEDLGAWSIIQVINTGGDNTVISGVSVTAESVEANPLPSIRVPWFVTMPPADKTYLLHVFGDFRMESLIDDADTNYWLQAYPEHVIRAARLQLEMDGHRNISGVKAFKSMLEDDLERMLAEDRFAFISGLTPEEAVRNG